MNVFIDVSHFFPNSMIFNKKICIIKFHNIMRSTNMRTVDKFEFNENQILNFDSIEQINARHTILRHNFTLKRISLKQQNEVSYTRLINETSVIKYLGPQYTFKCHKMLKTTNSLYLVYDHYDGITLGEYMINKKEITNIPQIMKQLIKILFWLKQKMIVLTNMCPQNIRIIKENNIIRVKITNLDFAQQTNKDFQRQIVDLLSFSQYYAREINSKIFDKIGYGSDMFSLGKIFILLEAQKITSDQLPSQSIIKKCIDKMVQNQVQKRISIEELKNIFFTKIGQKSNEKNSKSLEKKLSLEKKSQTILEKSKSTSSFVGNNLKSSLNTSRSNIPIELRRRWCLKILKKRCFALLMLNFSKICLETSTKDYEKAVIVSFLFLKKSAIILSQIAKYLFSGIVDSDIKMTAQQSKRFFKTNDCLTLKKVISREMIIQKKHINNSIDSFEKMYPKILKNSQFSKQLEIQIIDENYMFEMIYNFSLDATSLKYFQSRQKKDLSLFLVMVYIFQFKSFDKLFEILVAQSSLTLEAQPMIIQLNRMQKGQLVEKITNIIQNYMI